MTVSISVLFHPTVSLDVLSIFSSLSVTHLPCPLYITCTLLLPPPSHAVWRLLSDTIHTPPFLSRDLLVYLSLLMTCVSSVTLLVHLSHLLISDTCVSMFNICQSVWWYVIHWHCSLGVVHRICCVVCLYLQLLSPRTLMLLSLFLSLLFDTLIVCIATVWIL